MLSVSWKILFLAKVPVPICNYIVRAIFNHMPWKSNFNIYLLLYSFWTITLKLSEGYVLNY